MNKKRIILIAILIAVLVLHCSAFFIYKNYQAGLDFYNAVNGLSNYSSDLERSIGYFMDIDSTNLASFASENRHWFDYTLYKTRLEFQYQDLPIRNDVRSAYMDRFDEIYEKTVKDDNNAELIKLFTNPEEYAKMEKLRSQLDNMTRCCVDFNHRYNQMSIWEKCFTSWSKELETLSDKVKFS